MPPRCLLFLFLALWSGIVHAQCDDVVSHADVTETCSSDGTSFAEIDVCIVVVQDSDYGNCNEFCESSGSTCVDGADSHGGSCDNIDQVDDEWPQGCDGENCWDDCICICEAGPTPTPTVSPPPSISPVPTPECPYSLTSSGKCIYVSDSYHSFEECESDVCGPNNASLVCISDDEENAEVLALLGEDLEDEAWIGMNDGQSGEGTWGWNQECGSNYTNWASGEPNDYCGGEDCAMIYGNGKWNDQTCVDEMRCVCEYDAAVGTEFAEWDSTSEATDYDCHDYNNFHFHNKDDDKALARHESLVVYLIVLIVLVGILILILAAYFAMKLRQKPQVHHVGADPRETAYELTANSVQVVEAAQVQQRIANVGVLPEKR